MKRNRNGAGISVFIGLVAFFGALSFADAASLSFTTFAGTPNAIDWRGGQPVPASVTETYLYNEAADLLTVSVQFSAVGFAAIPPTMGIAVQEGFPIQFNLPWSTGPVTAIGPLLGFPNTDHYQYTISGLGRYVLQRPVYGSGSVPSRLTTDLNKQAALIAQAGHLSPWLYVPRSHISQWFGNVLWYRPGEPLYYMSEAAPLVGTTLNAALQSERALNPPETAASMSFSNGTRREVSDPGGSTLDYWYSTELAFDTQAPPPIWNLYGLARYYEVMNQTPAVSSMTLCNNLVATALQYRDWATLYWLRGHTPNFNAVHGVNQLFAGLIGYIRLARLAKDSNAEALGWGLFGRIAVLRYAMGKYTQFQHANNMFNINSIDGYTIDASGEPYRLSAVPIRVETDPAVYTLPSDPAWWDKMRLGWWLGDLVTWNWTTALQDVRQVERLDETGVDVWEWGGTDAMQPGNATGQKRDQGVNGTTTAGLDYWYKRVGGPYYLPFRDMVPELGRFLGDYLKPECDQFFKRVLENEPDWYLTYADPVISNEQGYMDPTNAYGLFLANAWILGTPPQTLEKWIDMPWLKQGDYFYLHKLGETIKAYRGVTWTSAPPNTTPPAAPRGLRKR